MMRRVLAIFFLLIFSCQILPIKAIGKILAKQQLTEEVQPDKDDLAKDDGKVIKFDDDLFSEHHSFGSMASRLFLGQRLNHIIYLSEELPDPHIFEIPSPPPDSIA